MEWPDFIWILGIDVPIFTEPPCDAAEDSFGWVGPTGEYPVSLYINPQLSDWRRVLLSEIIHAGLAMLTDNHFYEFRIDEETAMEEMIAGSVGTIIHSTFNANPWLVKAYIKE